MIYRSPIVGQMVEYNDGLVVIGKGQAFLISGQEGGLVV